MGAMALRPIDPAPGQRVLELGCGTGAFWEHNLDRVPADWDITISDWQDDMVAAARDRLDGRHPGFAFTKLDANAITRAPIKKLSFNLFRCPFRYILM